MDMLAEVKRWAISCKLCFSALSHVSHRYALDEKVQLGKYSVFKLNSPTQGFEPDNMEDVDMDNKKGDLEVVGVSERYGS